MGSKKKLKEQKKTILVSGAAGYIGSELVKKLSARGDSIVSMYRHRLPETKKNVFPVCTDLSSEELLAAPLRGVDVVVHLAWENNSNRIEGVDTGEPLHSANQTPNIELLKNLISAMEKAGTKRIIFVSAHGASKYSKSTYLKEKYLGEFFVLNSKIPEKIVLKSGIVYGGDQNRDRFINSIKRVMRFPGFYPVPRLNSYFYPVHIHDFIENLIRVVVQKFDTPVKVLDLIGEEALRIEDIFKEVCEKESRGGKFALGSFIGTALLPFFDNDSNDKGRGLRHYLSLGEDLTQEKAPGVEKVAKQNQKYFSFREGLRYDEDHLSSSLV